MKNATFILTIFSVSILTVFFSSCHDKKSHPNACFTVINPAMALGDTVDIKLCGPITRESEWDMGDTTYRGETAPKHIYKSKGTYTIILKSYEHMSSKMLHWQKQVVSEAQQTVTVQ